MKKAIGWVVFAVAVVWMAGVYEEQMAWIAKQPKPVSERCLRRITVIAGSMHNLNDEQARQWAAELCKVQP
jgi:hypothetical protein